MDGRRSTASLQVIVAHQQTLLRQVVVRLLSDVTGFGPVLEAATPEQVRAAASASGPTAVLLDEDMAGQRSPHLIAEVTAAAPDVFVILLTDDVSEESVAAARAAGVAAVVLKSVSFAALTDTIRRACASNGLAKRSRSA